MPQIFKQGNGLNINGNLYPNENFIVLAKGDEVSFFNTQFSLEFIDIPSAFINESSNPYGSTPSEVISNLASVINSKGGQVGVPVGTIVAWASNVLPQGNQWGWCDGEAIETSALPELYAVIGDTYNNTKGYNGEEVTTPAGFFRTPNLCGRGVVGQDIYNTSIVYSQPIGTIVGSTKIVMKDLPNSTTTPETDLGEDYFGDVAFDIANNLPIPFRTSTKGSYAQNEFVPTGLIMKYIIKVRS